MLQAANVSNQTWHGWSVAVFGCQMFKKWPLKCIFSERLSVKIYTITLAMIVVNIFHSKTELDANLRLIYAEARNKDGENYWQ